MTARTDALAVLRFVQRQPGEAVTHRTLAVEFTRRGYRSRRFELALAHAVDEGWLVGDPVRGGLVVPE